MVYNKLLNHYYDISGSRKLVSYIKNYYAFCLSDCQLCGYKGFSLHINLLRYLDGYLVLFNIYYLHTIIQKLCNFLGLQNFAIKHIPSLRNIGTPSAFTRAFILFQDFVVLLLSKIAVMKRLIVQPSHQCYKAQRPLQKTKQFIELPQPLR